MLKTLEPWRIPARCGSGPRPEEEEGDAAPPRPPLVTSAESLPVSVSHLTKGGKKSRERGETRLTRHVGTVTENVCESVKAAAAPEAVRTR